jgi:Rho-binding antiterminator
MQPTNTDYIPVAENFRQEILSLINQKKYVRIQYFSEIREFLSTSAIVKTITGKENAEFIQLSNGEEIRLDRIVRLGDTPAPGYGPEFFGCSW